MIPLNQLKKHNNKNLGETMECTNSVWLNEAYKTGVILPYFKNEEENEIYYLVSKDVIKEGVGENNWSGFGGFRNEKENCPIETAIREATEESIGLLADLAKSLKNKKFVGFTSGTDQKNHIYVIDLFSIIEEDRHYTIKQIYDFNTSFNELPKKDLKKDENEKSQIGWMKASEITKKLFSLIPHYTIYKEPSKSSLILEKDAFLRKCQRNFYLDVHESYVLDTSTNIENGWSGLQGQVIALPRNYKNFDKLYSNFRQWDRLIKKEPESGRGNITESKLENSNAKSKYKLPSICSESMMARSYNNNSELQINKLKPWDKKKLEQKEQLSLEMGNASKSELKLHNSQVTTKYKLPSICNERPLSGIANNFASQKNFGLGNNSNEVKLQSSQDKSSKNLSTSTGQSVGPENNSIFKTQNNNSSSSEESQNSFSWDRYKSDNQKNDNQKALNSHNWKFKNTESKK